MISSSVPTFLALRLNPGVTVGVLDNLVWNLLDITLNLCICELAADETFCGEECILGVDDSLTLCSNTN
jgi:hypothetical protein